MDTVIKLDLPKNASDNQIRDVARNNKFNGSYATKICRSCGMFISHPDGNSETAEIVDSCKWCDNERM
jgi:hypothetical protein